MTLVALLEVQCASRSSTPTTRSAAEALPETWALPRAAVGSQYLFRVRYEDRGGRSGMKLVLKLVSETDFQVTTTDGLGRPLWSLETTESETLLIDHRQRQYCVAGEIRLPETALEAMPWRSLPRLLLGHLPMVPDSAVPGASAEISFEGQNGRRWTAKLDAGSPESWILWEGEQPILWWSRQDEGGVLSHRQGVQFRWRELVREPLDSPPSELQIPPGYRSVDCHERGPS